MRFPYQSSLRIIPISPISDLDTDNPVFTTTYWVPCFAAATSGTFDPDIQFNGEALASGTFGQLVDVWISSREHRKLNTTISETNITFSAPLQLRLTSIQRTLNKDKVENVLLYDPLAAEPVSTLALPRGFPLNATRIYPTLTALTFDLKRTGL